MKLRLMNVRGTNMRQVKHVGDTIVETVQVEEKG